MHYARNLADIIHNDLLAAEGAACIDVLLLVGIFAAIGLADKVGRIKLQWYGFVGCAAGLLLASFSVGAAGNAQLFFLFAGFMLFNFMTNMGPNSMTYLLSGEVFPTHIRGLGAGFAASFAKVGAVLTAFFFPDFSSGAGDAKPALSAGRNVIAGGVYHQEIRDRDQGHELGNNRCGKRGKITWQGYSQESPCHRALRGLKRGREGRVLLSNHVKI